MDKTALICSKALEVRLLFGGLFASEWFLSPLKQKYSRPKSRQLLRLYYCMTRPSLLSNRQQVHKAGTRNSSFSWLRWPAFTRPFSVIKRFNLELRSSSLFCSAIFDWFHFLSVTAVTVGSHILHQVTHKHCILNNFHTTTALAWFSIFTTKKIKIKGPTFLCLSLLQSLFKYFWISSSSREVFLSNKRPKLSSGIVGIPLEYSIKWVELRKSYYT